MEQTERAENTQEEREEKCLSSAAVAAVVGASSGIGLEVAAKLASMGYRTGNISRTSCPSERIRSISADVAQGAELEGAIRAVGEDYGRIDVLVYSAGFSMAAPVEHAKEKDYRYLFEVNYFGALRAVQAAVPYMKDGGGKILFISSLGGTLPIPFDGFYSSSKAALDMLAREARVELYPYRIFVTAVQPGGTATGFTFKRKVYPDAENGSYQKEVNKAVAALGNMEQGGMSAVEVADCVIEVIRSPRPPITVVCGGKNKSMKLLERWLPEKFVSRLNARNYNQP